MRTLELVDGRTGEIAFNGRRVSRSLACPICAHLHQSQSWCLVDPERGLAICPRVESDRKIGDAGYLHRIDGGRIETSHRSAPRREVERHQDVGSLQPRYTSRLTVGTLNRLASRWGTSAQSIKAIGCGWDGEAWTFPMRDAEDRIVGYRRRLEDGGKLCLKGSHLGLIVGPVPLARGSLAVVEGESDLSAAVDLGLEAIARPGCKVCEGLVRARSRGRDLIIIADADTPGMDGARSLCESVLRSTRSVCIVKPPHGHKDLRDWVRHGATRDSIRFLVRSIRGY